MLRMYIVVGVLVLPIGQTLGQAEKRPHPVPPPKLSTPEGWTKESIALPPAFAQDMKWKGIEELRFAPNWRKADSDTFFSYGILCWLPEDQKIDAKTMQEEFLTYYRGLAKAVMAGKSRMWISARSH